MSAAISTFASVATAGLIGFLYPAFVWKLGRTLMRTDFGRDGGVDAARYFLMTVASAGALYAGTTMDAGNGFRWGAITAGTLGLFDAHVEAWIVVNEGVRVLMLGGVVAFVGYLGFKYA